MFVFKVVMLFVDFYWLGINRFFWGYDGYLVWNYLFYKCCVLYFNYNFLFFLDVYILNEWFVKWDFYNIYLKSVEFMEIVDDWGVELYIVKLDK